ncbi:outer membrane biogenesis protein BamB [Gimesia panareensis]|uniref:Outer membrane biogenesis protein BamB n=1 Tax=Gimesia panareensis TaxID=2527978 RepID=A0A517Q3E7_9PLAN|nr:PQQ-binding-like beta-propeller repeat protein [Gimesia panareensis]QDT26133.1 outer membrane biogenesis protein BamB [Gimesia panareensis]
MSDYSKNDESEQSLSQTGDAAQTEPEADTPVESPERPVRRLRWKWGLAVLVIGIAAMIIQWFRLAPDRTYQVFSVYMGIRNLVVGLLVWWMLISGVAWKTRFKGLLAAVLSFALFFAVVRVDGFEGDMVPRFQFRFLPTSEQRAVEYFENVKTADKPGLFKQPESEVNTPSASGDSAAGPQDWPGYRGAQRDGIAHDQQIRVDWETEPPKLLWKHPVGAGWGSFCVVGDRAFTQEQRGAEEVVVCYDAQTGKQLWVYADPVRFSETLGGDGPRATPTYRDGFLYTLGGTGILHSFEVFSGMEVWTRDLLKEEGLENLTWGMAGSPLIKDNLLIVNPGVRPSGSEKKNPSVLAIDLRTRKTAWVSGTRKSSYSSPQYAVLNGTPQVLIFHAKGLEGFALEDGRSLWFFPWTNQAGCNAAQPIPLDDSSVFLGAGYGQGSARIRITPSEEADQPADVKPEWKSLSLKLKFNCAVQQDGYVYGLDEGVLTCLDLETGKRQWKRGRYGYGQLLLVDQYLLILAEDGRVELVEANPEKYVQRGGFQAIEGQTWNHPALARGRLFVRNSEEAACYDLSPLTK